MMLCQYSDIFGKPREGVHAHRMIFDLAFIDVALTFVLAYLIWVNTNTNFSYWQVLLMTVLTGIVLHRVFCVRTTIDLMLNEIIK